MRSIWVFVAGMTALAACASADVSESVTGTTEIAVVCDASTTAAAPTTAPTTSTTIPASDENDGPPRSDERGSELTPTGLEGAKFGIGPEATLIQLMARFGEPTRDTGWFVGCELPALRVVTWEWSESGVDQYLHAEFNAAVDASRREARVLAPEWLADPQFVSYGYSGTTFTTPEGIGIGATVEQLRAAFPDIVFAYFGDDYQGVDDQWISETYDGPYKGRLSGDATDPSAVLDFITVGRGLAYRPC